MVRAWNIIRHACETITGQCTRGEPLSFAASKSDTFIFAFPSPSIPLLYFPLSLALHKTNVCDRVAAHGLTRNRVDGWECGLAQHEMIVIKDLRDFMAQWTEDGSVCERIRECDLSDLDIDPILGFVVLLSGLYCACIQHGWCFARAVAPITLAKLTYMLNIGSNSQNVHLVTQKEPFGVHKEIEATPAGWSNFEAKKSGGMGGLV